MKSKFRKIFWIRFAFGLSIFVLFLVYFVNGLMNFEAKNILPLIIAAVVLLFLSYLSIDLRKIFKITISQNAIVKTNLITRSEKSILFSTITSVEKEKVRFRNAHGNITDGHFITIIKFANDSFIISPDSFENYEELVIDIKHKLEKQHVA